jgi:hypothetical protein
MKEHINNIKKQITTWLKWINFMPILIMLFVLTVYVLESLGLDRFVNVAIFTWVIAISAWWIWALRCIIKLTKLLSFTVDELEDIKTEVEKIRKDII